MAHTFLRCLFSAMLAPLVSLVAVGAQAANEGYGWAHYRNERFGFELGYPARLFEVETAAANDDGRLWATTDGRARLLAGAVRNTDEHTLASYRRFLMTDTYAGAKIDYAPVRESWFVLSGTLGDQMFYERVTFTCGGRFIYGWQMTYPVAERALFDRMVEAVHRTYRAGRGPEGRC